MSNKSHTVLFLPRSLRGSHSYHVLCRTPIPGPRNAFSSPTARRIPSSRLWTRSRKAGRYWDWARSTTHPRRQGWPCPSSPHMLWPLAEDTMHTRQGCRLIWPWSEVLAVDCLWCQSSTRGSRCARASPELVSRDIPSDPAGTSCRLPGPIRSALGCSSRWNCKYGRREPWSRWRCHPWHTEYRVSGLVVGWCRPWCSTFHIGGPRCLEGGIYRIFHSHRQYWYPKALDQGQKHSVQTAMC